MANDTTITIVGNLTGDPDLRFTPNGVAVANFTVASTPRFFDRKTSEWRDGDALFLTCNAWLDLAEHVAESLHRGMRVMVTGRLRQRSYETRDGAQRTVVGIEVDEVGPSLKFATAKVTKATRTSRSDWSAANPPAGDPWATPATSQVAGQAGGLPAEPPF